MTQDRERDSGTGAAVVERSCDHEPIHIPGAIQPYGVLLSLRDPDLAVLQASENLAALAGREAAALIGQPLDTLLEPASVAALRQALASENPSDLNPLPIRIGERQFAGICHRQLGATILELEPATPSAVPLARLLRGALSRIQAAKTAEELLSRAVREIKALTGFDRVMAYRFDEDEHGSVVAEVLEPGLEPFLGLHYPASDIPRQARQLYLLNWVRIIPDVHYAAARLVPALRPDTGTPLDLSFAALRSISPVHLEYLRNMGASASMSLSLVVHGKLWGLVACVHQRGPHPLPYELRAACEVVANLTSLQLAALEELDLRAARDARRDLLDALEATMRAGSDEAFAALVTCGPPLLALVAAAGAAWVHGEHCLALGQHPGEEAITAIARWLDDSDQGAQVRSTAALSRLYPQAAAWKDTASGVLAISLPGTPPRRLLWFRPEQVQTVRWGGDPNKAVVQTGGERLHPRRSFELWKAEVRQESLPWTAGELEAAGELRRRAMEVDLVRRVERERRAVQARDDLVAVVSHDLRNPLGVIQMQSALLLRQYATGEEPAHRRLRASAERIQRAVDRMDALIRDLLDLAKIEAGRFEVVPAAQQPQEVVEDALLVLSPLAQKKNINLAVEVDARRPVLVDRERVFQVFSNLIGNAIKFTAEGGNITVRSVERAGEMVFTVADDGAGIPSEQLPRLFDRYWQARRLGREGAGLGLYIAKGIVEAHGGRIWVESTPGRGTAFHFTLRLAPPGQQLEP